MVAEVLTRTVAILRLRVMLYKAVVQKVLIGERERERESWVVTGAMLKVLVGFHHRVVIWIAGNTDQSTVGWEWEWPPVAGALDISGIWPINEYIQ